MKQEHIEKLELAKTWMHEVGQYVYEQLSQELDVKTKSEWRDLVTSIDVESEIKLTARIKSYFPSHEIFGEERDHQQIDLTNPHMWFIDPIDGTTNFVKQRTNCCILLAYFEQGIGQFACIYDLRDQKLYHAILNEGAYCDDVKMTLNQTSLLKDGLVTCDVRRIYHHPLFEHLVSNAFDIRCIGAGGLDALMVFKGQCVAFVNTIGGPWDFAALQVFSKELGLQIKTFEGHDLNVLTSNSYIIASQDVLNEIINR